MKQDNKQKQQKIYSAKKYFIYAFRRHASNENKILHKKFLPSIREILLDYIEIYDDINLNIGDKKLENAKKDIIDSSLFFIKENIFYKKGIYKEELDLLISDFNKIKENKVSIREEVKTYNKCKSIVKKISNDNIYRFFADIIKELSNYSEVDTAIECIISEMLYDGYSLKYIDHWYNNNIAKEIINNEEETINILIDKFKNFDLIEEEYKYYLTVKSLDELEEKIYLDFNMTMIKEEYDNIELINNDGKDSKKYLTFGANTYLYSVVVKSKDIYKGLEMLIDSLNSYFQMINYLGEKNEVIINEKVVVKLINNQYEKLRKEVYDDGILFNKTEKKEQEDIKDFIEYRDKVYSMNIGYDEIANIQRAINIIKGQNKQSKENKLINLWSVLEYMLTFNEGDSIIAKVRDIVPKVYCLYLIKDKINVFWNILNQYKNSKHEIVIEMIQNCKADDDEYRFDLNKFIEFVQLQDKDIINKFEFNDVLKRSIVEIGMLFNSENLRKTYFEKEYEEIKMDLVRIYRDRNVLIHSGRRNIRNINYKTLRLYQYNNNILGVIIYYKKKNPNLTIEEILNSIDYTYNKYATTIAKKLDNSQIKEICRPKYLFIE